MPKKVITSSSNISILDSKIDVNTCDGNFYIDITPSTFIGVGANNMLGAKVRITNPYGVAVKDYTASYDIAAPFTSTFQFGIPTEAGNYQFGQYTIDVQITDANNSTFTVTKTVNPCYPDPNSKDKDYGSLSANIKGICKEGKVYVSIQTPPVYNGLLNEGVVQSFTFEYPTNTLPSRTSQLPYFSDYLFEGVYKLNGQICANYNADDNISYKVKYKVKAEKRVYCQIDECAVFANLVEIHKKLDNGACKESERMELSNQLLEALALLKTAQLANDCGEDASEYIEQLEGLLKCKCSCGLEGSPIVSAEASGDVVIDGWNIAKKVDGLTTRYTINNFEYKVEVAPNGGFLTASAPAQNGGAITTLLTFDIAKVYAQIKAYANENAAEQAFWAAFNNKVLDNIDATCLGDFGAGWATKTFAQRIDAIKNAACAGYNFAENYTPPTIPAIPDNVNGAVGYIPLYITDSAGDAFGSATKAIGNSLATQQNGQIAIPVLAASNSNPSFPYALVVTKVQPLNNSGNLLGAQNELHVTGSGLVQTNEFIACGNFGVLYLELTGNATMLGRQHSGIIGSLAGKIQNATLASPMVSSVAAVMDFQSNGHYQKVAGLFVDRPGNGTSGGGPAFAGTIDIWYGAFISSSVNGGLTTQITKRFGVYQEGENDPNVFAAKSSFSLNLIESPTSNVHIKGLGYEQLRLENAFTPTGPSDARGQTGDQAWDANYLYWKSAGRWNRVPRDTTWVDPS